jgi:hypothetical protein
MQVATGANLTTLSTDPSLTAAGIIAGPGAGASITGDVVLFIMPNSQSFSQTMKIPLLKGTTLYLNSSAGTWCVLLFDDSPVAAELSVT